MATDPTRLRGDGAAITLRDGTTRSLVFDFDALCEIEESFGALRVFTKRLAGDGATKLMQTVSLGVTAALRHCEPAPSLTQVRREMLDSKRINEYREALDNAFVLAMPDDDGSDEDGPKASGETDSPGTTSTTSEPSSTDEATASSGE